MPKTNKPLTPEQRAEIARQNGAKSPGPKTEPGKATVSRNALKHGFAADKHHVTDDEDYGAYSQLHDAYFARFAPTDPVEVVSSPAWSTLPDAFAAPSTWMPTPSTPAACRPMSKPATSSKISVSAKCRTSV